MQCVEIIRFYLNEIFIIIKFVYNSFLFVIIVSFVAIYANIFWIFLFICLIIIYSHVVYYLVFIWTYNRSLHKSQSQLFNGED